MSLKLNILEQLIATEFDVGREQCLILSKNVRNPTTGVIEFNTQKETSNSGVPVEELVRSFYENSGYDISEIEHQNFNKKNFKILKFSAEKHNHKDRKYTVTVLKTSYHNSIFINQIE